jgi:hypothetical protein
MHIPSSSLQMKDWFHIHTKQHVKSSSPAQAATCTLPISAKFFFFSFWLQKTKTRRYMVNYLLTNLPASLDQNTKRRKRRNTATTKRNFWSHSNSCLVKILFLNPKAALHDRPWPYINNNVVAAKKFLFRYFEMQPKFTHRYMWL